MQLIFVQFVPDLRFTWRNKNFLVSVVVCVLCVCVCEFLFLSSIFYSSFRLSTLVIYFRHSVRFMCLRFILFAFASEILLFALLFSVWKRLLIFLFFSCSLYCCSVVVLSYLCNAQPIHQTPQSAFATTDWKLSVLLELKWLEIVIGTDGVDNLVRRIRSSYLLECGADKHEIRQFHN